MTTLPAAGYASDAARTTAEQKQFLEDVVAFIRQNLSGDAEGALTLATDSITPTVASFTVETEGGAATDNLSNIVTTNFPAGSIIILRPVDATHVITVKHSNGGAGQIALRDSADVVLNATTKYLMLKRVGANWVEIARFGFQEAVFYASASGGTADVATLTIAGMKPSAWTTGMIVIWNPPGANTVTTPTINPSSMGAKTVVDRAGNALAVGALASGTWQVGVYNGTTVNALFLPNAPALGTAQAWTAPQRPQAKETANKSGSVTPDFATYQDFDWTLTAAFSIANATMTSAMVGQRGRIRVAHAGYTLSSLGSHWKRIGATGTPTLSTTSGEICIFDYHIVSTSRIEYSYGNAEA